MQYVACKFRREDTRTYTYEWDGEPLLAGDAVLVPDNRGGPDVDSMTEDAPPFACKRIIGKAPPKDDEPKAEAEPAGPVDALDVETF